MEKTLLGKSMKGFPQLNPRSPPCLRPCRTWGSWPGLVVRDIQTKVSIYQSTCCCGIGTVCYSNPRNRSRKKWQLEKNKGSVIIHVLEELVVVFSFSGTLMAKGIKPLQFAPYKRAPLSPQTLSTNAWPGLASLGFGPGSGDILRGKSMGTEMHVSENGNIWNKNMLTIKFMPIDHRIWCTVSILFHVHAYTRSMNKMFTSCRLAILRLHVAFLMQQ